VIPAIDLRGGRVVRLEQGDFTRETSFSDDPIAQVRTFVAEGAPWIHVVDLDGARDGQPRQRGVIAEIVRAAGPAMVQVAGGLRTFSAIDDALGSGAARAVLGTVAITDPRIVGEAVRRYGSDRITVALDVRGGHAVGGGWLDGAPGRDVPAVLEDLLRSGVTTVVVTGIDRDGLLGGPDVELLGGIAERGDLRVIASGGVTTIDDLEAVRRLGCAGAIVGRAIYDGRLDLGAAIRTLRA
jgi:phosphoribosylformimino-5-aminoimidazole carboxamide ribotide isomerase